MTHLLVQAGWEDQPLMDLLIHWRREVRGKPKLRLDYYQRTIARARDTTAFEQAYKDLEEGGTVACLPEGEGAEAAKARAIKTLRPLLKFDITRWVQYGEDVNASVVAFCEDGKEIAFGPLRNLDWKEFKRVVRSSCLEILPVALSPLKRWEKVEALLCQITEIAPGVETPTREQALLQKLEEYVSEHYVADDTEDRIEKAQFSGAPFVKRGLLWVNRKAFCDWLSASRDKFFSKTDDSAAILLRCSERKERHYRSRSGRLRRKWYYGFRAEALGASEGGAGEPQPSYAQTGLG